MDAEEVQNHAGNQKKLIDIRIASGIQIGKLQLLHCFRGFACGRGTETDTAVSVSIDLQNYIVVCLVLPAVLITRKAHHHFVQPQNVALPEVDMLISQVDLVQRISVPGNLRLVVVQRGAVLIDNGSDTLVAGHNALDGVGAFDGLHLCDSFQLREDLRVFFLAHASHSFERRNIGSEVHKVCRQQAVIQKGVIESSHTAPAFLHIIIAYYVQKNKLISQLSAYTSLRYMQIEHPNRQ